MAVRGYQVAGLLGRTPAATVYLAQSEELGRPVALKVLHAELAADPQVREQFLSGARLQARLIHPGIVQVLDFGVVEDQVFLATDYCRGGDLSRRMERGMQLDELVRAIGDIAHALDCVHANGFVHRDVKPANVLFRDDGSAQLSDFGIAIEMNAGTTLSPAGTVRGSASYMSPEQAAGESLDGRSDVYALGVVLFEMLTGAPPFAAGDAAAVALRQLQDPVPRLPPHLEPLQGVLDKALAKLPADRYPSGAALAAALAVAASGTAVGTLTLRSAPVTTQEIRAVGAAVLASARRPERDERPKGRRRVPRAARIGGALAVVFLLGWWLAALVDRSETAARVLAVVGLAQDPAVQEAWDAARALDGDPNQSLASVVSAYRRVLSLSPGHRRAQEALNKLAQQWKSSVEGALVRGNVTSAAQHLSEYLLVFPSDPVVADLSERISNRRTADNLVNNALAQLRMHGVGDMAAATLAIRSYQEVLRLVPEHPVAQTELNVIAEHYAGRAAEAAAAGDMDDAIGYLDRASSANATLPLLEEVRSQVRLGDATNVAIGEILDQAARFQAAGALIDPPGANAAELYHRVLATDPDNAVAGAGIDAVVDRLIVSINEYLKAGDLVSAGELVARAGELGLDQAAVAGTRVELERELARFNTVVRNLEEASALLDDGFITEPQGRNAVLLLREVEELDPGNQTARALLQQGGARLAEVAMEAHGLGMKRLGREYLELALTVTPEVTEWQQLLERWERDD